MEDARREILRQALTDPTNTRLDEVRDKDARLGAQIRRAERTAGAGTTGAVLGALGAVGLGVATLLGAPLALGIAAAGGVGLLGLGVRAAARSRIPRLEKARRRLELDYEGQYLAAERILVKIETVRGQLAVRYDHYERGLERRLGANAPERKAPVLAKARSRHLAAVRRLDAMKARCNELLRSLDKASRVVQAKERFEEFELAELNYEHLSVKQSFKTQDLHTELDTMVLEFESFTELEHLRL